MQDAFWSMAENKCQDHSVRKELIVMVALNDAGNKWINGTYPIVNSLWLWYACTYEEFMLLNETLPYYYTKA